jgi:hypothetical protein
MGTDQHGIDQTEYYMPDIQRPQSLSFDRQHDVSFDKQRNKLE